MKRIIGAIGKSLIVACGKLPAGTRRLIFVASLAGNVKQTHSLDRDTVRKLNTLMELCDTESSFSLPVHLREVIWNGVGVDDISKYFTTQEVLPDVALEVAIQRIMAKVPAWLHYETMRDDISRLLTHRTEVFG